MGKTYNRGRNKRRTEPLNLKRLQKELTGQCTKTSYGTEEEAERALHNIIAYGYTEVRPNRSYECPFCKTWHLTHSPLKGA